jgi:hypothetical protein
VTWNVAKGVWTIDSWKRIRKQNFKILIVSTVKPVYNGRPSNLKKVAVWQRCLIKLRLRLVVDNSNWPLLTGGRCSQVVVQSGLTVIQKQKFCNLDTHLNCNCNWLDPTKQEIQFKLKKENKKLWKLYSAKLLICWTKV